MKVKQRMVANVSLVYPHDRMAAWELELTATAQHYERVSYCFSLSQEKIKIQNIVSIECALFSHHYKVKKIRG